MADSGVTVREVGGDRRLVEVEVEGFVARRSVTTAYPQDLIDVILRVRGPAYVCDEIAREEDPSYVANELALCLLSFVVPEYFAGKRVLDFGCGGGASTLALARMLPDATIVGVELVEDSVEIARRRAAHYGLTDVEFHVSPAPDRLPDIGSFDAIVFSAVFEHLLPDERGSVLDLLWAVLNPGGVLFINQLPYRWSPVETHTTGLPLINYLPDRLTYRATQFSRLKRDEDWDGWLRRGIRGSSQREVLRLLSDAEPLRPTLLGMSSHADLWFALSAPSRKRRAMRLLYRLTDHLEPIEQSLSLAFRKPFQVGSRISYVTT